MKQKTFLLSGFICIALIIGTGPSAFAQMSGFFVEIGGFSSGPHDEAILRGMVSDGRLTRESLVWREGMANWTPAGTVAELAPLFAGLPPPLPAAPPPLPSVWEQQFTPAQVHADHQNFTTGERWGTFLLNAAIPGLGSFIIMRDTAGGIFNIALGVGAYVCYILYFNTIRWHWQGANVWRQSFPVFWIAGAGLHVGQFVHNAVRSFTFNRPLPPGVAFLLGDDAFDIALVSGQNGTSGVAFTWTLRY